MFAPSHACIDGGGRGLLNFKCGCGLRIARQIRRPIRNPQSAIRNHVTRSLLRKGQTYKSLDVVAVTHHQTGEPFVEVSQANSGLIRRDLLDQESGKKALARFSVAELLEICARAAEHFAHDALPLGDHEQTPEDYVRQVRRRPRSRSFWRGGTCGRFAACSRRWRACWRG